jgi:hypothetical protein
MRCLTINPDAEILSRTVTPEMPASFSEDDDYPMTKSEYPHDQIWSHPMTTDGHTPVNRISHNKKNKVKEESKYSFEQFWLVYDKKVDKKQTLAVWNKLSDEDRTLAVEGMGNHKSGRERKYWKDPIRYLRDRRWEDETTNTNTNTKQTNYNYDPNDPRNKW